MKCGFAKAELSLKLPCRMAGYAVYRVAEVQHDPLLAEVLILETEQGRFGYITLDLIAVHQRFYEEILKVCKPLGFDERTLMICATHTHAGCMGVVDCGDAVLKGMDAIFGAWDEQLAKRLADIVYHAVKDAMKHTRAAMLRTYTKRLEGVGANRNDPACRNDSTVFVMEFQQKEGNRILFLQMACHPTVLNAANLQISADLAGAIRNALSQPGEEVLFFNGACGDISTRFTRKNTGFAELTRYEELIKQQLQFSEQQERRSGSPAISSKLFCVELKKKAALSIADAELLLKQEEDALEEAKKKKLSVQQLRFQESRVEGARANLIYAQQHVGDTGTIRMTVVIQQLAQETLIFLPLEMYSRLSSQIPDSHIHFICYANGYHLYITDEEAFSNGYYEACISPFERGEGEHLIRLLKDILTHDKAEEQQL